MLEVPFVAEVADQLKFDTHDTSLFRGPNIRIDV